MLLRIFTAITLLSSLFVIISVSLQTPIGMVFKSMTGYMPGGDKMLHFLLLTGLSFLLNASLQGRRAQIGSISFLLGSILVGTGITLEEFSQVFIPGRNFEFLDMVCNYAGIYLGSLLLFCFPTLTTELDHDHRETFSIQTIFYRARPLRHEGGHRRHSVGRLG